MNKEELVNNGFLYITDQESTKSEIWAKFSGYKDVVLYFYYFEKEDSTDTSIPKISDMSELEALSKIYDTLR